MQALYRAIRSNSVGSNAMPGGTTKAVVGVSTRDAPTYGAELADVYIGPQRIRQRERG
jgi:hypothetical protein